MEIAGVWRSASRELVYRVTSSCAMTTAFTAAFLDPFHGGTVLSREDCFALVREVAGIEAEPDPRWLEPVGKRDIMLRMLRNLGVAYAGGALTGKAIDVLNLLISAQSPLGRRISTAGNSERARRKDDRSERRLNPVSRACSVCAGSRSRERANPEYPALAGVVKIDREPHASHIIPS